jgi:hypothetical protein
MPEKRQSQLYPAATILALTGGERWQGEQQRLWDDWRWGAGQHWGAEAPRGGSGARRPSGNGGFLTGRRRDRV